MDPEDIESGSATKEEEAEQSSYLPANAAEYVQVAIVAGIWPPFPTSMVVRMLSSVGWVGVRLY